MSLLGNNGMVQKFVKYWYKYFFIILKMEQKYLKNSMFLKKNPPNDLVDLLFIKLIGGKAF